MADLRQGTTVGGNTVLTSGNFDPANYPGMQGAQGRQGPTGPGGGTGPQGRQGPTGPGGGSGPQGRQGPTGPGGPGGNQGRQGPTGPGGPGGNQGRQGPTGPGGPGGAQGRQGPTGPGGGSGPQGRQGPIGPSANQSLNTSNNVRFNSIGVGTSASSTTGYLRATNDIVAYYSDERLKDFLGRIENAIEKVEQLNGYYFKENDKAKEYGYNNEDVHVGLSAQEVQKVLPEVIAPAPINDSYEYDVEEEYLTVKYDKVIPLLVEAIKELNAKIDGLKS